MEFDAKDSVLTAQTKTMKMIDGFQIEIQVGTGSTLYVTNFPPTADEAYIRNLFKDVGSKASFSNIFSADNVNQFGEIVDVRFPSLKYNTHRRFCYVQFSSSEAAHAATSLDGKQLGEKGFLVVKISAPNQKKERSSATADGREVYIRNIDFQARESDVRDVFAKYGRIEKVRLPPGPKKGTHKGFGFVTYESKEEADACLAENGTRLKSRELEVSIAQLNPAKFVPGNAVNAARSVSPAIQHDNHSTNGVNASPKLEGDEEASGTPPPDFETIKKKTLGIMNLSDTVNDARLRTLFEPFGPLRKVALRPAHQGAIIEYEKVADAGKASLALDGKDLDGMKIQIGDLPELMNRQPEKKITKGFEKKKPAPAPAMLIPRSQTLGGGRGRGGGQKRGLGFTHAMSKKTAAPAPANTEAKDPAAEGEKKPGSSNEEFKKMFLAGR